MKKTLLLFLFWLMIVPVFSQEYEPVLKEGAFWDVEKGEEFCGIGSYTRFEIGTDTIINNITYKKIRLYNFSGHYENPCMVWDTPLSVLPDFSYTNYIVEINNPIFIRENISEKKVYVWAFDENSNQYKEYTLYDFSLQANDVMTNSYIANGNDVTIAAIETDEHGKKRYNIQNLSYYTEGLGAETGILFLERIIGPEDPRVFCYGNTQNQNNCARTLSIDKFKISNFRVSPNPVKEKLFLSIHEASTVKIYSVVGQLIDTFHLTNNKEIQLSNYTKGIYILKITNQQGFTKTSKFIKE